MQSYKKFINNSDLVGLKSHFKTNTPSYEQLNKLYAYSLDNHPKIAKYINDKLSRIEKNANNTPSNKKYKTKHPKIQR